MTIRQDRALLAPGAPGPWNGRLIALKLALLAAFMVLTNFGFGQRIALLLDNHRFGTLLPFLFIWALAALAVVAVALHPRWSVRVFWGLLIAASTAVAWGYHRASQSELTVFDILSLWNARHEAGRAADFYGMQMILAGGVFVIGALLIILPPVPARAGMKRLLSWSAALPLVPVLVIGGIVLDKAGGGSQSLPVQFAPIALSSLAGAKVMLQGSPERQAVTWKPEAKPSTRNILMLVDESVRADYIDFTPGNPYTPGIASLADRFVNFGPAVSGGNCSNYSNAILRFAASREDIVGSVNTSPTLWQYAKKAGFRTVFIDAQAGGITNPGLMQNFMTLDEKAQIDAFYAIRNVDSAHADEELAKIVEKELVGNRPVFIYANKNGAHFPYDHAYPVEQAKFHPTMAEAASDTQQGRIASYRNAIAWSVDRFMSNFFAAADLSHTTVVYTSDHAQTLDPNLLTHCQVDDPDPRMGVVPLMVFSPDPATRAALAAGAQKLKGSASHFDIAPTLLHLMGYAEKDISMRYDKSLFDGSARAPAFTSGDIFGLFGSAIHWNPVDLKARYLEPQQNQPLPQAAIKKEETAG
ncbi:sulfatase-like hydrolase/transferase [Aestuariivirga sp.]|uniref:sulfatase-like hydrolase/transferase n=1 Tax=Aestuariivirga sp. TaxID=2650926 RepID=UPI0039E6B38C